MMCLKCEDKGWLLYQKDAPSPPYKQGMKLDYGVRCDACYGASRDRKSSSD
jgi:hypothetical protein